MAERNDRMTRDRDRMRNQEDESEQGTRGDQDKMSERESPDPPNIQRGEQAIGKQPHVRMEDREKPQSER